MLDRILKVIVVLGGLLLIFSIAFYFIYFLPNKESVKKKIEFNKFEGMKACFSKVFTGFNNDWNQHCAILGLDNGCYLPKGRADTVLKQLDKDRELCLKIYK